MKRVKVGDNVRIRHHSEDDGCETINTDSCVDIVLNNVVFLKNNIKIPKASLYPDGGEGCWAIDFFLDEDRGYVSESKSETIGRLALLHGYAVNFILQTDTWVLTPLTGHGFSTDDLRIDLKHAGYVSARLSDGETIVLWGE